MQPLRDLSFFFFIFPFLCQIAPASKNSGGSACNFDTDMCGWKQSSSDDFQWTRHQGPTPSNSTGPLADHTTGLGNYMYIETSHPREYLEKARLVYDIRLRGSTCLRFYYNMYGATVGELNVYVSGTSVLTVKGNQGKEWMMAELRVNESDTTLVIEGVTGRANLGDIAIDDVILYPECNETKCPLLKAPTNGNLYCTADGSVGSMCNASCDDGFFMSGSKNRTCMDTGVWTGAIVECSEVQFRLVGGHKPTQGRLEVTVNGVRGSVCDDKWSIKDASVVCRMLGLPNASVAMGNAAFGEGKGPIWLIYVECDGTESSLLDCMHGHDGWGGTEKCSHWEDAGVICGPIESVGVKLVNGGVPNQGLVQVAINNVTGSVCDDGWIMNNAEVVCRELGLPEATANLAGSSFGIDNGTIWLDDVTCIGNESHLLECNHRELGTKDCAHKEDAGVVCGPPVASERVSSVHPITWSGNHSNSNPSWAVDNNYRTCFFSDQVIHPWLQVTLVTEYLVNKVQVFTKRSSMNHTTSLWQVTIQQAHDVTTSHGQACGKPGIEGKHPWHVFRCDPPIRGQYVTVRMHGVGGQTTRLVICEIAVHATGSLEELHGVRREMWYVEIDTQIEPVLRYHPVFKEPPQTLGRLQDFDMTVWYKTKYGQHHEATFKPPTSGDYTFFLSCEDECEMWLSPVHEQDMKDDTHAGDDNRLMIKLTQRTQHRQWHKYPRRQRSKVIYLSQCLFYSLDTFVRESNKEGHLSLGMRDPSGTYERPITGRHLYWTTPGYRSLSFSLTNYSVNTSVVVKFGAELNIIGTYSYCCHGAYCPNCPLIVRLHVLHKSFLVSKLLDMNCISHNFSLQMNADANSGRYSLQVGYSFVNDSMVGERRKILGNIEIEVSVLEKCSFDAGTLCFGWKIVPLVNSTGRGWEIGREKLPSPINGGFAFIDSPRISSLESPSIAWQSSQDQKTLCLSFAFYSNGSSSLHVFSVAGNRRDLLINLIGYYGQRVLQAQVSWTADTDTKIVFEGSTQETDGISVAIDNVRVTTEVCNIFPPYSTPGYQCEPDEFQCANRECVKSSLRCDGDTACIDGTDEKGCKCVKDEFACSTGDCVHVTRVCDGARDCPDGEDESKCGSSCPDFQCVSGNCVPWSETCTTRKTTCGDDSHRPSICGNCSLNDLTCSQQNIALTVNRLKCQSFRGYCGFESGLCGFEHDSTAKFRWSIGSGSTPSFGTGPSIDHTTLTKYGTYIFIEASNRHAGDQARLISDWLDTREDSLCLQFWYLAYGRHIGSLNVYTKISGRERLVWSQNRSGGDRWLFAQTPIEGKERLKIILEGVTGDGSEGDIAVDDLAILTGSCDKIVPQRPVSCRFVDSTCSWDGHQDWKLHARTAGKAATDPSIEGYLYLSGGSDSPRDVTSPVLTVNGYVWKCVMFWFYSGGEYFRRSLTLRFITKDGKTGKRVWSMDEDTGKWGYVQFPVTSDVIKIVFQGSKPQHQPILAIRDVSFSKESCKVIAPLHECTLYKVLNDPFRREDAADITRCDDHLEFSRWYRIMGRAGTQMTTHSVPRFRCGSRYPGWMKGSHPSVTEGPVVREVCFVLSSSSTCWRPVNIQVRNCGQYYVYKYTAPTYCPQTFCTTTPGSAPGNNVPRGEWYEWRNKGTHAQWIKTNRSVIQHIENGLDKSHRDTGTSLHDIDYELHFPGGRVGHVILTDVAPMTSFTACFWIRTMTPGLVTKYNVISQGVEVTWLGLIGSSDLELVINNQTRKTGVLVNDDHWHHVCITWTSESGTWLAYKDGHREASQGTPVYANQSIPGGGNITIGHSISNNSSQILTRLGFLNIWDYVMEDDHVTHMSYGYDDVIGNIVAWPSARKGIVGNVKVFNTTISNQRGGERLTVYSNSSRKIGSAIFVSPWFNSSTEGYGACLKFKYKIRGRGTNALWVYQQFEDDYFERPIWMDDNDTGNVWRYGQVSLGTNRRYKLKLTAGSLVGFISIGGLYVGKDYCENVPQPTVQACNQILTKPTGYITSPYYPGYYTNNSRCTWLIAVPTDYVISLKFLAFSLEGRVSCDSDYVEVRDGGLETSPRIGRYCGEEYPAFIKSTSNKLRIEFKSNGNIVRTGFKAHYNASKRTKGHKTICIQDCPPGCRCFAMPGDQGTIVESLKTLLSVPGNLPRQTAAILFSNNTISRLRRDGIRNLNTLQYIDLSRNVILKLEENALTNLKSLQTLRLNGNFIKRVSRRAMTGLDNLKTLDLGDNEMESLSNGGFSGLRKLNILSFRRNKLTTLEAGVFGGLENLTFLYLHNNSITTVQDEVFANLGRLRSLWLNNNKIKRITKSTFTGLDSLEQLFLDGNNMVESEISPDAFHRLKRLRYLTSDSFIMCCYAKNSIGESLVSCDSPSSELSSCDDLMKNTGIRAGVWILGIMAFLGNLFVIIWRNRVREDNKVQSFLLLNLACADFLMGVYLLIIAAKDTEWKGEYFKHDIEWRKGLLCQFAGALSMLSSEVSVLMLTLITWDRLISIVFALKSRRTLSRRRAYLVCSFVWMFGSLISILPITGIPYFYEENHGFYGRSAVCLPLQLSRNRPAGWEYSVTFFIVMNFASFMFILIAYTWIFYIAMRVINSSASKTMKKESAKAERLFFIVMSDFCCWMPVIIIGILSLFGSFKDPKGDAYVWIAVFVLPVNSSINPILYTFSMTHVRRKMTTRFNEVLSSVADTDKVRSHRNHSTGVGGSESLNELSTRPLNEDCKSIQLQPDVRESENKTNMDGRLTLTVEDMSPIQDANNPSNQAVIYVVTPAQSADKSRPKFLIKCFPKDQEEAWQHEVNVLHVVFQDGGHPNLMTYRWDSRVNSLNLRHNEATAPLEEDGLVLCYEYSSQFTLSTYLTKKAPVSLSLVLYVAMDTITAIEYLHQYHVCHGSITGNSILIRERAGIPPITAQLGDFSKARYCNNGIGREYEEDIRQFGHVLDDVTKPFSSREEYSEILSIAKLCIGNNDQPRPRACTIRGWIDELCSSMFMETAF